MIIAVIFSLDLCGIFSIDIENIEELRKKVVFSMVCKEIRNISFSFYFLLWTYVSCIALVECTDVIFLFCLAI